MRPKAPKQELQRWSMASDSVPVLSNPALPAMPRCLPAEVVSLEWLCPGDKLDPLLHLPKAFMGLVLTDSVQKWLCPSSAHTHIGCKSSTQSVPSQPQHAVPSPVLSQL